MWSKVIKTAVNLNHVIEIDVHSRGESRFEVRAWLNDKEYIPLGVFDNEQNALAFITSIVVNYNESVRSR